MNVLIRKMERADMAAVHQLVRELAIYEKAENEVTTNTAIYEQDFDAQIFEGHVAEMEGKVVGMTLFYMSYSTWKGRMLYLEDFVVNESYRRYGVGQLLFDAYLEEAKAKGCKVAKWQVLDWNTPAQNFYVKNNATIEKDWYNGKIFL